MTNRLSKAILQHIAAQDDLLRMYSFYRRERHDEIARIFYVDHQFGSAVRRDCTNRAELLTTVRHKGLKSYLDGFSHNPSSEGFRNSFSLCEVHSYNLWITLLLRRENDD